MVGYILTTFHHHPNTKIVQFFGGKNLSNELSYKRAKASAGGISPQALACFQSIILACVLHYTGWDQSSQGVKVKKIISEIDRVYSPAK